MIREASLTEARQNKALFLDRDGVLIEYVPYLSRPEQVRIPEGAGEALKKWQDAGYLLIVITNQSGIGRGYFTLQDVEAVHLRMCEEYEKFGVKFKDLFLCPHHPSSQCICRKPSPYMVQESAIKYSIDLSQSFFVGDAPSDIECAVNAGCQPILINSSLTHSKGWKDVTFALRIKQVSNLSETWELAKNNINFIPSLPANQKIC
jgi:D-glycero-D-manno-heptose 1,7-bisphosphate phosphatase